jgi:hypothetical protein
MAKASLSPTSGLMTFGFSDGFGDRRRADMTKPLKKILNPREVAAYYELQRVATEYGYGVHIKMRLADVFPVEKSGIAAELYTFALRSHFDFVVSGEAHDPLFAVEFDGPSHRDDQRKRDAKKNELCKIFSFPLLRINTRHLVQKYNKASLLRWIISAWELQKAFCEAQNKGQMPLDEDFDPIFLWHAGNTVEEVHPHWIALKPRLHLKKLQEQDRIPVAYTCGFTFLDDGNNYHGIEWIDVNNGKVIFVESGMREQRFPLYLGELFSELMTVLLHDKLIEFLSSGEGSVDRWVVTKRLNELRRLYRFAGSHSGSTKVNFSLSLGRSTSRFGDTVPSRTAR